MRPAFNVLVLFVLLQPFVAFSYVGSRTTDGNFIQFKGKAAVELAGNSSNTSGISKEDLYAAVVRGLQRWKAAAGGSIDFNYWQGDNTKTYEPNSGYNGLSSIYFASAENDPEDVMDPSVIGVTQVWYDTSNGDILETDVKLNDVHYQFSTNPEHTSGSGSGKVSSGNFTQVFVENVITHELGHAYGLSHSGSLQATMLYLEAPDQAHLSCDDQVGIRALYPSRSSVGKGTIKGSVNSTQIGSVFGAHVVAISAVRGVAVAATLTDRRGDFEISQIEPGPYFVMVEPYYPGSSSLPPYYENVSSTVCGGSSFSRTFVTDGSEELTTFDVTSAGVSDTGTIFVECSGSGASVQGPIASPSMDPSAPLLRFDSVGEADPSADYFGVVDRFVSTGTQSVYYRIEQFSGNLELRALAFSLFSPVGITLEILDSVGNPVAQQGSTPAYSSESGYSNFDGLVNAEGLPLGDYYVKISSRTMGSLFYPGGSSSIDSVPYFVLTGVANRTGGIQRDLAHNAKCRMEENFPAYVSPIGGPPRKSTGGSFLGCGSVSIGGPSDPSSRIGAMLPFMLILLFGIVRQSRHLLRSRRKLANL